MHTVVCAVCTMRDSEGVHVLVRLIQTETQINTHINMYSGDTGSHLQEHQACPREGMCVCVCESDKRNKKRSYDGKT